VRIAGLLDPEDRAALRVQGPVVDQLVDPRSWLERRIQLNDRLRPQQTVAELLLNVLPDAATADGEETVGVGGVLVDEPRRSPNTSIRRSP
jgi:hypothetical protein